MAATKPHKTYSTTDRRTGVTVWVELHANPKAAVPAWVDVLRGKSRQNAIGIKEGSVGFGTEEKAEEWFRQCIKYADAGDYGW